jgi:hypothetical protein
MLVFSKSGADFSRGCARFAARPLSLRPTPINSRIGRANTKRIEKNGQIAQPPPHYSIRIQIATDEVSGRGSLVSALIQAVLAGRCVA